MFEVTAQYGPFWEIWGLIFAIFDFFWPRSLIALLPVILALWGAFEFGRVVGGRKHA